MPNFRILFFTQEDPFYVRIFFEKFFQDYENLHDIVGVIICRTMGEGTIALAKRLYGFYGPGDFLKMAFRYVNLRAKELTSKMLRPGRGYSVKQICKKFGITVILCDDINKNEFLDSLKHLEPDLIISVACPKIFKKNLIAIPKKGCINIHHAPLPKYRGMMPNFWQMYHGEKQVGITVHKINPAIDDGEIIFQEMVSIGENETLDSLIKRTKSIGADCMIKAIRKIKDGDFTGIENRAENGSYFSFPTKEDVKRFRAKGIKIL